MFYVIGANTDYSIVYAYVRFAFYFCCGNTVTCIIQTAFTSTLLSQLHFTYVLHSIGVTIFNFWGKVMLNGANFT